MHKLSDFVIKHRIIITIVFTALCLLCAYGVTLTEINSDVLSYLPSGTDSTDGQQFIGENFGAKGNMIIAVSGDVPIETVTAYVDKMKTIEGVSSGTWIGDVEALKAIDMLGGTNYYGQAAEVLNKDGNYLIMLILDGSPSTPEAAVSVYGVEDLFEQGIKDDGGNLLYPPMSEDQYAFGGTCPVAQDVYDSTMSELPWYVAGSFVLVLIILILTASSFVEPFIFMATLGVAIILNMGTNFIFGSISIITYASAAVMQLGLAMDYAIFLTHAYREELSEGLEPHEAMKKAIPKTFTTILASALTTIGGFGALMIMQFTLGKDLGVVLIKGIVLSLITVIILQPCLLLLSKKIVKKTEKKPLDFKFAGLSRFSIKHRILMIIICFALIGPAFIGQFFLKYTYIEFLIPEASEMSELDEYVVGMSNQLFICVPVDQDNIELQYQFVEDLTDLQSVENVTGLYSLLPQSITENPILMNHYSDLTSSFIQNGYTLYTVSFIEGTSLEGQDAMDALDAVKAVMHTDFPDEKTYITGMAQGVHDFQVITPHDFLIISIISIVAIFLILALSFRSLKYPILLVLLIQFGIWINLSLSAVTGQAINFMSYLVISSIQLGATVDYAILVTGKYRDYRKQGLDVLAAAEKASIGSSMSVLTSASIMAGACVITGLITSNEVVREICFLIARGSAISCLLVLCVLPSVLAISEKLETMIAAEGGIVNFTGKLYKETTEKVNVAIKETTEKVNVMLKETTDKMGDILKTAGDKIKPKSKKVKEDSEKTLEKEPEEEKKDQDNK
jgi:predicted RND superfamily exporter protein